MSGSGLKLTHSLTVSITMFITESTNSFYCASGTRENLSKNLLSVLVWRQI